MDENLVNQYIALLIQGLPMPDGYSYTEWWEAFNRLYDLSNGGTLNPAYNIEIQGCEGFPEVVSQYLPDGYLQQGCPDYIETCYGVQIIESECNCWANGTDYMSFGWDPNPGCCYGCMDPNDWKYRPWATCHVQEACKLDCNGMEWSWIEKWNETSFDNSGPWGGNVGCYDEDGLMIDAMGNLVTTPWDPDGGP